MYDLKTIVDEQDPDLIFISEPWLFQSDLPNVNKLFPDYNCVLNSDDKFDEDVALIKTKAYGGCMTLYKKYLEPFVSEIKTESSRILPIQISMPGYAESVHFNIYLPTSGKDSEFLDSLATMKALIEEVTEDKPGTLVYIRGDANASYNVRESKHSCKRDRLFQHFVNDLRLHSIDLGHMTYHHFTGDGNSDSSIDIIVEPFNALNTEVVDRILCLKSNPNIDSHHDIILSHVSIPTRKPTGNDKDMNIVAPRVENDRVKIIWSTEGIQGYQQLINPILPSLREEWLDDSSPYFISTLLHATNEILSSAAIATNRHVKLREDPPVRPMKLPPSVLQSSKTQDRAHKNWLQVSEDPSATFQQKLSAKEDFSQARRCLLYTSPRPRAS